MLLCLALLPPLLAFVPVNAAELEPHAAAFTLPGQIGSGPVTPGGNQQAVLVGDPTKPGSTR